MSKETLCTPRTGLEMLLRNWLAGSKTVVSISRDATVPFKTWEYESKQYMQSSRQKVARLHVH